MVSECRIKIYADETSAYGSNLFMGTFNGDNVKITVKDTILYSVFLAHQSDDKNFHASAIIGRHTGVLLEVSNVSLPVSFFATKTTFGLLMGESNNTAFRAVFSNIVISFADIFHGGDKPCGGLIGKFVGKTLEITDVSATMNVISSFPKTSLIIGEVVTGSSVLLTNTHILKFLKNDSIPCLVGTGSVTGDKSDCKDSNLPS